MIKEVGQERVNANGRSALEKERTKMRERGSGAPLPPTSSASTAGGYCLPPAHINGFLRHLAQEAGWTVDPDGTTYRSATSTFTGALSCPLCGGGRKSAPKTPSCSFLGGGGGDCSTTASPRRVGASSVNLSSNGAVATEDTLLAIYTSGAAPQNFACGGSAVFGEEQQQFYLV